MQIPLDFDVVSHFILIGIVAARSYLSNKFVVLIAALGWAATFIMLWCFGSMRSNDGRGDMEQYISHLKKYRQLAELTQEELANRIGVRRETIIRLESAKYNPSLNTTRH